MKKIQMMAKLLLVLLILSACSPSEWEEERRLGQSAQEAGNFKKAIKHYKKAIKLKPSYQEARDDLKIAKKAKLQDEIDKQQKKSTEEKAAVEKLPLPEKIVKKFEDIDTVNISNGTMELVKEPSFAWDETTYLSNYTLGMFKALNLAFSDPQVNKVVVSMLADLEDDEGNESAKEVVNYSYDRKTFEGIDYEDFISSAYKKEWKIFKAANEYSIHPAIYWATEERYQKNLDIFEMNE